MGCENQRTVENNKKINNGYPVCKMTIPLTMDVDALTAISEDKLFYLMSRGLTEEAAKELIILGFVNEFREELPMEYAVELNRLLTTTIGGV